MSSTLFLSSEVFLFQTIQKKVHIARRRNKVEELIKDDEAMYDETGKIIEDSRSLGMMVEYAAKEVARDIEHTKDEAVKELDKLMLKFLITDAVTEKQKEIPKPPVFFTNRDARKNEKDPIKDLVKTFICDNKGSTAVKEKFGELTWNGIFKNVHIVTKGAGSPKCPFCEKTIEKGQERHYFIEGENLFKAIHFECLAAICEAVCVY